MSRLRALPAALVAFLLPVIGVAQPGSDHPGYFPIEDLEILPEESINLEINLTGPMMKFIALATDEDDPELSKMVEDLESIRVRGADLEGVDVEEARSGIQRATTKLVDAGWSSMVRMREDDEEVYIYFKEEAGQMVGLTVLSLEGDEAMLINLVGKIDPTKLSSLAYGLDLPQLDRTTENTAEDD